jgi:hypothetical protein
MLKHKADCFRRERPFSDLFMTVNGPKDRSVADSRSAQPISYSLDRTAGCRSLTNNDLTPPALLVGLALRNGDRQSFVEPAKRFDPERNNFGSSKGAVEPDRQQRIVPAVPQRGSESLNDGLKMGLQEGADLGLRSTMDTPDSTQS